MSHDIIFDPPDERDVIRTRPSPRRRRTAGSAAAAPVPPPPAAPPASAPARRTATVVLEVLAGLRATGSAAQELGITPMRYYQIEERAIGGLVAACEPRPAGVPPERRDAQELARLRDQVQKQAQELSQVRSVLRTTQRQLGVTSAPEPTRVQAGKPRKDGKPRKATVRRPTVRALTMVRRLLRAEAPAGPSPGAASTPPAPPATSTPEPGGG